MSVFVIDPLSLEASLTISLSLSLSVSLKPICAPAHKFCCYSDRGKCEGRGTVTIQEHCRGGDPEANLTEENSGIPGGTFRSASRLVRLKTPRHRLSVNIFTHQEKLPVVFFFCCSCSGGGISSSNSNITSVFM
jgi:hypothetical protein